MCVCLQEVVIGLTERYRLYANDFEVGYVLDGIFAFTPNATRTTSWDVGRCNHGDSVATAGNLISKMLSKMNCNVKRVYLKSQRE